MNNIIYFYVISFLSESTFYSIVLFKPLIRRDPSLFRSNTMPEANGELLRLIRNRIECDTYHSPCNRPSSSGRGNAGHKHLLWVRAKWQGTSANTWSLNPLAASRIDRHSAFVTPEGQRICIAECHLGWEMPQQNFSGSLLTYLRTCLRKAKLFSTIDDLLL